MSKKKSKTLEQADIWVQMMDAKADANPKSVSSILWKIGGLINIPFVSFGLLAIALILVVIGLFSHVLWHWAGGIAISALIVTIWNSVEKYQDRKIK